MPEGFNLFWGDAHCNVRIYQQDRWDDIFAEAARILDFFPVAYYPFEHVKYGRGLDVETVRNLPQFQDHWKTINELTAKYHEPGQFVTFPGYEWHGNRERWGDHNVFFPKEGCPLLDTWDLPDLVAELKRYDAVAFPHHTGYMPGERGKDWSFHDPETIPLAEIFSAHGCSESDDTPVPMIRNTNMGPRTSGGTIVDGLLRGHKFGIMASNDSHHGFAGTYGVGLMGIYAGELTREAVWEAVRSRRAYGVTGDRIQLEFDVDGLFMGGAAEKPGKGPVRASWRVSGADAIDRVELIRNGEVIDAYHHLFSRKDFKGGRLKVRVEAGWGPDAADGFEAASKEWPGSVEVEGGRVLSVQPCFTRPTNRAAVDGGRGVFRFVTFQRNSDYSRRAGDEGAVFEIDCPQDARVVLDIDGAKHEFTPPQLLEGARLFVQYDGIKRMVAEQFDVGGNEVDNPDVFFHNAWKYRLHRAAPDFAFEASGEFVDERPPGGESFYYLRVFQRNGQAAWSSPVWISR